MSLTQILFLSWEY